MLESQQSSQVGSAFTVTVGVKSPQNVFIHFQCANKVNDEEQNDSFKINPNNKNCYFQSPKLEVRNEMYYPELE